MDAPASDLLHGPHLLVLQRFSATVEATPPGSPLRFVYPFVIGNVRMHRWHARCFPGGTGPSRFRADRFAVRRGR